MARSTRPGATASSQPERALIAKPPASHRVRHPDHARCDGPSRLRWPRLGALLPPAPGVSQEPRGEKREPSKEVPGCRVTLGQTSQAPEFPCFASLLPACPWRSVCPGSGQNYLGEDPPALRWLIRPGLNFCACGTTCELSFPLASSSPSPRAEALCSCRDGVCCTFGERRVKRG